MVPTTTQINQQKNKPEQHRISEHDQTGPRQNTRNTLNTFKIRQRGQAGTGRLVYLTFVTAISGNYLRRTSSTVTQHTQCSRDAVWLCAIYIYDWHWYWHPAGTQIGLIAACRWTSSGLITTITHSSHCWHQQQHLAKISPIYFSHIPEKSPANLQLRWRHIWAAE